MGIKLRTFFQLVRIPAVFSSLSNVYAGFWIGGGNASFSSLGLGMAAAGLFLMAGMALNDIADFKVDKLERPNRPLPSGAMSLSRAWILSLGMMVLGLLCQWRANPVSALVGVCLIAAVFLYNFLLKGTMLGSASMGLCRALNLLCGVSLSFSSPRQLLAMPWTAMLSVVSLFLYVAIVTYLARDEVKGNSFLRIRIFFGGLALWSMAWMGSAIYFHSLISVLLLAVLLLQLRFLHPALNALWRDKGSAPATGKTVGAMLRTMSCTDCIGMLAAGADPIMALLTLGFMLPGPFLARRFYST